MIRQALAGVVLVMILGCPPGARGEPLPKSSPEGAARVKKYEPTDRYDAEQIEGWRVLVNKNLRQSEPELCAQTLRVLGQHLFDVARRVPPDALAKLRQISIWVELDESHHRCMAYHPDAAWLREHDMNPEKAGCVEIANARNFLQWTLDQPAMVLHELAHGYHDRFLPRGFKNPEIEAAFQHAKEANLYESVLSKGGKRRRAYAMNNPMEYFAETSEALLGTNDFYPFVRAELEAHDPPMVELLKRLWGVK